MKPRKSKRLTKADREAMDNWQKLNSAWDKLPKFSTPAGKPLTKSTKLVLDLSPPPGRETTRPPSLSTPGGQATKARSLSYTGTAVIGIAQMAKSNAVPEFSQTEAIDVARMRRN